jgi:hypothetical protein
MILPHGTQMPDVMSLVTPTSLANAAPRVMAGTHPPYRVWAPRAERVELALGNVVWR